MDSPAAVVPVYDSTLSSIVFYADDDLCRQIHREKRGSVRHSRELGRYMQLRVALVELIGNDGGLSHALSLQDLSRDQRYVHRDHIGDGLFAYVLRDLPGIGIRLVGEGAHSSEAEPMAAGRHAANSKIKRPTVDDIEQEAGVFLAELFKNVMLSALTAY